MRLIAFGHRSGVGKDTCCKALQEILSTHGVSSKRISFADKVKSISHELYDWAGLREPEYYETHREERHRTLPTIGLSPLEIWIAVGNTIREHVYPHTWSMYAIRDEGHDVGIITDLRTPDELAVLPPGTILVKVIRSSVPMLTYGIDHLLDDFTKWHYTLQNEGTVDDLYEPLRSIAEIEGLISNG